jgi:hypothetical protein
MKTKKIEVPALRDDPEYAIADNLCIKLAADIAGWQRRRNEKLARQKKPGEPSVPVMRMLGDTVTDDDGETVAQLDEWIRTGDAAHKIAIQRRDTSRIAAGKLSFQQVDPAYRENVKDVADALVLLNGAVGKYEKLVNELQRQGVPFHIWARPMSVHFVERADDKNGPIAAYLREAAEYKLIDARSIPESLR